MSGETLKIEATFMECSTALSLAKIKSASPESRAATASTTSSIRKPLKLIIPLMHKSFDNPKYTKLDVKQKSFRRE
jgi:hypothetical protein